MKRDTPRSRSTVLIDTNILVSGLVFLEGNEHQILKLAEDKAIVLLLPEFVLEEARAVLGLRFSGHEILLEAFLLRAAHTLIPWDRIEDHIPLHKHEVRDEKDAAVLTSTILAKPDFVITGDKTLREDLKRSHSVPRIANICSSSEFLRNLSRPIH